MALTLEIRENTCMDETDRDNVNDMALMGGIVSLEKELINQINNSTGKVYWKQMQVFTNESLLHVGTTKWFGKKVIHFIDSGGQMQYHDILPLFVQNINVAILF